jgi:hypothetical protein
LLKTAIEKIQKESHKLAEVLYAAASAGGAGSSAKAGSEATGSKDPSTKPESGTAEGEVIDAEYEDVDPSK